MKKIPFCLLVLSILLTRAGAASAGSVQANELSSRYIVGPGDVLEVSVWKDEALSRTVTVLPDGTISLPLIGEYMAMGKSINLIREEIKRAIEPFVPNPELIVGIQQVNSMWVYVIGKVMNAGRFQLNSNVNVLQVLSMAGGFNSFADSDKIKIFREKKGKTKIFSFNYTDVARGKNLYANIRVKNGDVIVVP
jgi:polysaccharide export outer membrane protein